MHLLIPHIVHEKPSIYVLMVIGVLSSLLIGFFWDATSYINGEEHSTGLLTLLFFLSLVDCSSSVLFMPFMARFRQAYLTSYLIGEGLSGFLPSIFALMQGVGGNPSCRNTSAIVNGSESWQLEAFYPEPNFSVSVFFFILMGLMICCAASFIGLNHCEVARRERYESVATRIPVAVDNQTFVASSEIVDPTFKGKSAKITYPNLYLSICYYCKLGYVRYPMELYLAYKVILVYPMETRPIILLLLCRQWQIQCRVSSPIFYQSRMSV